MSIHSFHSYSQSHIEIISFFHTEPFFEVCMLAGRAGKIIFEMSWYENSPEPSTSSGTRALLHSEVVEGKSAPLENDYSYRYQKYSFEDATGIALGVA